MDKKPTVIITMFIVLSAIALAAGEMSWNDDELQSLGKIERKAVVMPYCTIYAVRCNSPNFMGPTCVTYRKICPVYVG
ncbi:unnamed protein product [Diamesa hyperborea]